MVHSKAKTRAVKAAALMLSIPVMAHAMTAMDRVPLPVPRPTWLDAAPLDEVVQEIEATPAPVQVASLPDHVPLPIARPRWLGRVTVDIVSDAPLNDALPLATKVVTLPARVPLPIPRPDFLDAAPADDETAATVTHVPRRAPADETARNSSSPLHSMIEDYARYHGVPLRLAHRIVQQESRYNPALKAKAHFGLMQVSLPTAKSMGYGGDVAGLLDAKTNLTYAMPYLANAWIISGGNEEKARRLYMSGYYPDAKRKGLLKELRKADSPAAPGEVEAADAR
jgi:soluble lytic murein transglycosylase-like protein